MRKCKKHLYKNDLSHRCRVLIVGKCWVGILFVNNENEVFLFFKTEAISGKNASKCSCYLTELIFH